METQSRNLVENASNWLRRSVTLKLLMIFILMMLLLIPLSFIKSLIIEREMLKDETTREVSSEWANSQTVYGPVLTIPLEKKVTEEGKITTIHSQAHFLPAQLEITGNVEPRSLKRGMYEVVVYDSKLSFSGNFDDITEQLAQLREYEAFPQEAFLTISISDMRGIKENVVLRWNEQEKKVKPGSGIPGIISSGITIEDILIQETGQKNDFSFELDLRGSQFLGFVPLGKNTSVKLSSHWTDPGFTGSFLPAERNLSEEGFTAQWQVLELNRNYPQFWTGNKNAEQIENSSFGVKLLNTGNDYQKSMRSAKYALLAISLTFLTFFMIEIFNKNRVHPFQYILVGLALVLFYILLVSISEHLGFNLAYLISSISVIAIIGLYSRAILKTLRQTLALIVILGFVHAFVYITLQNQNYALLTGSIGLTAILAFTMYLTRKVDWYELNTTR